MSTGGKGLRLSHEDFDAHLYEMVPLSDGRDYIILCRQFTKQNYQQALDEQSRYLRVFNRLPTQHDTPMP